MVALKKFWLALLFPLLLCGYEFDLAVTLIFQNEARFLKEWIEYHRLIGVQHFYLYNNLSQDNYLEILQPYIEIGEVELFDVPIRTFNQPDNLRVQCKAYNAALGLAKGKVKWLAFIDADEYLFPLEHDNLLDLLEEYEDFGGVHASWLVFGTSHIEKLRDDELRIEKLLHCDVEPAALGKSIVRPERVKRCTDPHVFLYMPPFFHVSTLFQRFHWHSIRTKERLLIYHYYTGDIDHLLNTKLPRRVLWYPHLTAQNYVQEVERYNRVYNPTMLRFVPHLKSALNLNS